jgi:hypothetical protein
MQRTGRPAPAYRTTRRTQSGRARPPVTYTHAAGRTREGQGWESRSTTRGSTRRPLLDYSVSVSCAWLPIPAGTPLGFIRTTSRPLFNRHRCHPGVLRRLRSPLAVRRSCRSLSGNQRSLRPPHLYKSRAPAVSSDYCARGSTRIVFAWLVEIGRLVARIMAQRGKRPFRIDADHLIVCRSRRTAGPIAQKDVTAPTVSMSAACRVGRQPRRRLRHNRRWSHRSGR